MEKQTSDAHSTKSSSRRDWLKASGVALVGSTLTSKAESKLKTTKPSPQNPVRMMYNENPLPPSPQVKQAMLQALEEVNTYSYFRVLAEVKARLAEREGVSSEQILSLIHI